MSEPTGPVRRRRIAGESAPVVPERKAPAPRRTPTRKPVVKKAAPAAKASTPAAAVATKPARPASSKPTVASPPRERTPSRPSRSDLRWLVPAVVVTAVVLVLGALLAVRGVADLRDDSSDLDKAQRQATSAAATSAESIFSYRFDQLDQYVTDSQALMTPAFAKTFAKIGPVLDEIAPQNKVQVKAVARNAAPIDCGEECSTTKVDVLVFVDMVRLVGGSDKTTVFPNRIKVSMVKQDDGWLVGDIVTLSNSPALPGETPQADEKAN
ncbi:hypothetical protein [Aeromicrobium chenweiae]|uniref:Uncharacterized protein n=1 Tax=Aeromicrobium chenweiae TaxID=2079793 RepID=A0A2S0WQ15_9ACTN|nr:hypothetical protein [Aeromicrobium chenweiae]AWB93417.1 hypothetical protein C3E78_15000 [Aeromicrobium chenweiae]TGN34409.1 hypothetical protein E4L97_05025 [Aeromicrobium chenweiae]